jgi:hypothetical protein
MAGLSGKSAYLAGAKQTVKGTAITAPTFQNAFAGGNIGPVRETDRLSETDSSRDQSAAYVTTSGVEGSPEVYVRPRTIGYYLMGVLGSVSTTGTMPNFVHTFKPGNSLPYYTLWRNVGGATGIIEKFTDCQFGSGTFSAEAGAPLTAAMGVTGITPDRLTVAPTLPTMDSDAVFNFNNAAVALGGGVGTPTATRLIRSFEFSVENNLTRQQTDDVIPYDISPGQREISLGFDMLFESLDEYNKFHYGGAAGVAVSSNIFTTNAKFTFTIDANTEISFEFPSIAYEEFPIEPDPGGDPIVVSARAVAQKATGVTDLVTVVLKNSVTAY